MIIIVSAGSNDQSNRTPREMFEPVDSAASLRLGTRVRGGIVRAIGLERGLRRP